MSNPYRDREPQDDEPIPDFGKRSSTIAMILPALCASALMGAASFYDVHDAWLSLFLSAPVTVVVGAIVLLQAPVRRWRARRDARAIAAGMNVL